MGDVHSLSSRRTVIMKFVIPPLWHLVFGLTALSYWWLGRMRLPEPPMRSKVTLSLTWALGALLIWRTCVPLKRVQLDGTTLVISDYRSTIRVPVGDIEEITESRWISLHPVTLHFRRPTGFGDKVVFMPKARPFWVVSSHPVVAELRALTQGTTHRESQG